MGDAIQFDAQGRPYQIGADGRPAYLSPGMAAQAAHLFVTDPGQRAAVNAGLSAATLAGLERYAKAHGVSAQNPSGDVPNGTFAHSRGTWNPQTGQYDQGMNMGGLGGLITGGAALAAPFALGALMPEVAGAAGGSAAGGAAAGGAMDAGAVIPGWGAPVAAAGAAPSVARSLVNGLTSNIGPVAGIVSALAGGGGGGNSGTLSADAQRIQQITEARMRRADPLHQMLVNLAASRMPTNMQLPIPQVPLPPE